MAKYNLFEGDFKYDTIESESAKDALAVARSNVDRANYDGAKALFVKIEARNVEDEDDRATETVVLPELEPDCLDRSGHNWGSPHDIVGGDERNPGVWGKGGGIIAHKCCLRCGCQRITDTWAQNPIDGTQGHLVVKYVEDYYDVADVLA